jgi:hypothetical protein
MMLLIFDTSLVHFLGADNVACALFCAALFAFCSPCHSRFIGGRNDRGLGLLALHFNIDL